MRKFADYLIGIEHGPVPPEGAEGSDGDPPARAWLQRADTDQDEHSLDQDLRGPIAVGAPLIGGVFGELDGSPSTWAPRLALVAR